MAAVLLALAATAAHAQTFGVTVRTQNAGAPVNRIRVETGVAVGQVLFTNAYLTIDNQQALQFREATANGTNVASIRAPASLAADYTLTLPADDGAAGQVLSTDGAGGLSWIVGGGGAVASVEGATGAVDLIAAGTAGLSVANSGASSATITLNDAWVDTTGDTMTGTLTVSPSGALAAGISVSGGTVPTTGVYSSGAVGTNPVKGEQVSTGTFGVLGYGGALAGHPSGWSWAGVYGYSGNNLDAIYGYASTNGGTGVYGVAAAAVTGYGVRGYHYSATGVGVRGDGQYGVQGNSLVAGGAGVYGMPGSGTWAGRFAGSVGIDAGQYLNFGVTQGSGGYGFRDNAGTIEYKDSAGAWAAFGGGGLPAPGTAGRILYDNGAAWVTLNPGTAGQVLTMSGGLPTWQTPSGGGGTNTWSSTPGLPITDSTNTIDTITVSGAPGTIVDVNVAVNITHTWSGDLQIYVTPPSGVEYTLQLNFGGSLDDVIGTYDDAGSTGTNIETTYQLNLTTMEGGAANGNWQIRVYDSAAGDSGTLNSWSVTINYSG